MTRLALALFLSLLSGCYSPGEPIPASGFAVSPGFSPEDRAGILWAAELWCRDACICVYAHVGEPVGTETPIIPLPEEDCGPDSDFIGRAISSTRRPPVILLCPGRVWTDTVAAHEMGHALVPGIDHTDDPASLMYPLVTPNEPEGLTAADYDAIAEAEGVVPWPAASTWRACPLMR